MYGAAEGGGNRTCCKGYRGLAAETQLDKDTVRDLIAEFKAKGIVAETGTYNADTRESKTYQVLPSATVVDLWRTAGIHFVTAGRRRPVSCTAQGQALTLTPTTVRKFAPDEM